MIKGELAQFWQLLQDERDFDSKSFLELYNETDEQTVLRILAQFRETLMATQKIVSQTVSQEQVDPLWKAFHKVSGSAALLGFQTFGDAARNLSHQIKANPDVQCHELEVTHISKRIDDLIQKISKGCPNLSEYLS